jgi:hypothetical protein
MSAGDTNNQRDTAREVFARQQEIRSRGGDAYARRARLCEDFYLGGGLQWRAEDRARLEAELRPCHEINDVMPAVNSAGGYQIANRMDVAYLPLGGGTDEYLAKVFSKFAKHCLDGTGYRDRETDVFLDGLIQQRGFFDMRMDYSRNSKGDIKIEALDPLDVGVDPDARDYDPDEWSDATIARWLTLREIEQLYGKGAAQQAKEHGSAMGRYGNQGLDRPAVERAQFGDELGQYGWYGAGLSYQIAGTLTRYLVIERQSNEYAQSLVGEYPTGELKIFDGQPREVIGQAIQHGVLVAKRRIRRVRWETVLPDAVIFNGIVPYEHMTIIPFFPYFRRGRTRGMVDNAISPQEMTNKFVSQYAAVINTTANSGWQLEKDQLTNMTTKQLERKGSMTGVILERKPGTAPLVKIEPNQVPAGIEKMIQFGADGLRRVTGVNESLMGMGDQDMSGVAIQSRQFAAQQQLAIPLWRLSQTRRMIAVRLRKNIQRFMVDERVARICETDEFGCEKHTMMPVNQVQPDGYVLHDMTIGDYDVAITEQPINVTYDNSQFEQIKSLAKDFAYKVPPSLALRYSTLTDKQEVGQALNDANQAAPDPAAEAKATLDQARAGESTAKTDLIKAQTAEQNATALFSATRVAQLVAATPGIAEIADALAKSCGFEDHDPAPIVPTPEQAGVAAPAPGAVFNPTQTQVKLTDLPTSTNPLAPDHPDVGARVGEHSLNPPTQ